MSTVHDSYVAVAPETGYGATATADRFFEFVSEGISGSYERIESEAIRAGRSVLHKDRFVPNPKGASGDVEFEVLDTGFGVLLKHALGASETTGAAAPYTHVFTPGELKGQSLTVQVGRVDNAGVLHPFTYSGGKVTTWELKNEVDGILMLSLGFDFAKEKAGAGAGPEAAQTPVLVDGAQLFTFVGGSVQIDGVDFPVNSVSIKGDNGLKTDRYALRGANSTTKREPLEESLREFEFEVEGEFEGLTHFNRVAAAAAAGALASITCTWSTPNGSTLTAEIPFGRFDEGPVNASREITTQSLSGKALTDDVSAPVTLTLVGPDATV